MPLQASGGFLLKKILATGQQCVSGRTLPSPHELFSSQMLLSLQPRYITELARADIAAAHLQELSRSQQQEMAAVLGLLRQYADTAASCAAPPFIVGQCAAPLQRLQRALIDNGPLPTWQTDAVQLLQCLLQFYTVLLQRCQVRLGAPCDK